MLRSSLVFTVGLLTSLTALVSPAVAQSMKADNQTSTALEILNRDTGCTPPYMSDQDNRNLGKNIIKKEILENKFLGDAKTWKFREKIRVTKATGEQELYSYESEAPYSQLAAESVSADRNLPNKLHLMCDPDKNLDCFRYTKADVESQRTEENGGEATQYYYFCNAEVAGRIGDAIVTLIKEQGREASQSFPAQPATPSDDAAKRRQQWCEVRRKSCDELREEDVRNCRMLSNKIQMPPEAYSGAERTAAYKDCIHMAQPDIDNCNTKYERFCSQ